jgi:hypothetical protein
MAGIAGIYVALQFRTEHPAKNDWQGGYTMKLQEIMEDIENTCRTCKECFPSCAANIMKCCIEREIRHEDLLQSLSPEDGVLKIIET